MILHVKFKTGTQTVWGDVSKYEAKNNSVYVNLGKNRAVPDIAIEDKNIMYVKLYTDAGELLITTNY